MIKIKQTVNDITVRNATRKDIDILASWWADGSVMAHAGFPHGIQTDKEKLASDIKTANEDLFPKSQQLIIEYQREPIGEMNYRLVQEDTFEIGIKICESEYQNKGLGKDCMHALLDYLFHMRDAKSIMLDTNELNKRAQHFYKKLGFKQVGVRKNAFTNQLGEEQTAIDFEMKRIQYKK